jgi:hypothetical protein
MLIAVLSTRRSQIARAACLALLLVATLALALPDAGEAAGPGTISGTVRGEGGVPLSGVEVCAFGLGPTADVGCVESEAGGSYEIGELAAGSYEVGFYPPSALSYVLQYYDGVLDWHDATPVSVGVGVTGGIDAEREPGATLGGTVTAGASGLPVAGVVVCVESTDGRGYGCAETDGAGSYVVKGLPPGLYEVEFQADGIGENLLSQVREGFVSVSARQEVTGIDAALQTGGQIGGTVRAAATGSPLKDVEVCVTGTDSTRSYGCLKTPPSGRYRFLGVPTGAFRVVFSPEASELENGENYEIAADAFPTQWWSGQSSFATATSILVTAPQVVENIDGSLGPGPVVAPQPAPAGPPATAVVKPKPRPVRCHKGQVKKKVKGKARCVKRHRPKRHHRKHHPKLRRHAGHSR